MTSFSAECEAFGDIVDQIQQCTDASQLQQLSAKGYTTLLLLRNIGYNIFDVTEQGKTDAETARKAFDAKTLVLQNMLYENGYYQKEIQEARNHRSAVSDSDIELIPVEEFLATAGPEFQNNLDTATTDYDHQLLLKRLEHEVHSRKQARQQLGELRARRDALQTSLSLKRKATEDLTEQVSHIKAAAAPLRNQIGPQYTPAASDQQQLAQLLPLSLYLIYSQTSTILQLQGEQAVDLTIAGEQGAAEQQVAAAAKLAASSGSSKRQKLDTTTAKELYQAFPLSVNMHIKEPGFKLVFYYLPALGLVTVEAQGKPGNELLVSLFHHDTGIDTPNEANHQAGDEVFVFDAHAVARPYRWAQWLAGLDFLPALPAGLIVHGDAPQAAVQAGLRQYRKEKRAMHVLATLVRRAKEAHALETELSELLRGRNPLAFPNAHFQQAPAGSFSLTTAPPPKARAGAQAAGGAAAQLTGPEVDEDEEGEVQEIDATEPGARDAQSMQVDSASEADHTKQQEPACNAPVPIGISEEGTRQQVQAGSGQDAGQFLRLHAKSPTGWQLDAQVCILPAYPATAPDITLTVVKEAFRSTAASQQRRQLTADQTAAMQTQVQNFAANLDADEKQHVLSYQIAYLSQILTEQTVSMQVVEEQPTKPALRPSSAAGHAQSHTALRSHSTRPTGSRTRGH